MDTSRNPAIEAGKIVLHVGVEAHGWGESDFAEASKFAHSHKVDSLAVKMADGGIRWYRDTSELVAKRKATTEEGCGLIPFQYSYGPRFPMPKQIHDEASVALELALGAGNGNVCLDVEDEWFDKHAEAAEFATLLESVPILYVSTYAAGSYGGRHVPMAELARVTAAWCPQEYNNYLIAQEAGRVSVGHLATFPTLDLTQEFGPNDVVRGALYAKQRGHPSLWFWEYAVARNNPSLFDRAVNTYLAGAISKPVPAPVILHDYTVQEGDSLSSIAAKEYGNPAKWVAIYNLPHNREIIGSDPDLIQPGQILQIPKV